MVWWCGAGGTGVIIIIIPPTQHKKVSASLNSNINVNKHQ